MLGETATKQTGGSAMSDLNDTALEAEAADPEDRLEELETEEEENALSPDELDLETPEADAAEQSAVVELDEDEYR
ncbi:hypothetical protein [Streptacidiphilus monticola]|uniref:Uncharacterized protein n=1 Tax=Streptacidiphilus monticola TaxID=2161674 RepID=A0ABW1G4B2_9ACTN